MAKRKQSKNTRKKRLLKKADRHSVKKNKRTLKAQKTFTGVFDASSQGYGFIRADEGLGYRTLTFSFRQSTLRTPSAATGSASR